MFSDGADAADERENEDIVLLLVLAIIPIPAVVPTLKLDPSPPFVCDPFAGGSDDSFLAADCRGSGCVLSDGVDAVDERENEDIVLLLVLVIIPIPAVVPTLLLVGTMFSFF